MIGASPAPAAATPGGLSFLDSVAHSRDHLAANTRTLCMFDEGMLTRADDLNHLVDVRGGG